MTFRSAKSVGIIGKMIVHQNLISESVNGVLNMSCSTLLRVYKTKALWDVELRNSWGTGPACWDYLMSIYMPDFKGYPLADEPMNKLYELLQKEDTPLHHKVALLWCGSKCLLLKEHLPEVVKCYKKVKKEFKKRHPGQSLRLKEEKEQ